SQVLSILVSNAMKFTPRKGKIEIKVRVSSESGADALVEIGVQDGGPGISETDKQNLFRKFAFTSAEPTDGEKGAGLGLAIAKRIEEMHRGRIWVESKPNQGSYFAFAVPKSPQYEGPALNIKPPLPPAAA